MAVALKGKPKRKTRKAWRWGNRESFALYIETGIFFDHEADLGGGVLALAQHKSGAEQAGAFFIEDAQGTPEGAVESFSNPSGYGLRPIASPQATVANAPGASFHWSSIRRQSSNCS